MDVLLERLKRRDPAAFQEAMVRFGGPLQRALERLLRDRAEAEDVVQECFARLFMNVDSVRTLKPWLFGVAMNLGRNVLRSRARSVAAREPRAHDADLQELVDEALEKLPEKARVAFVLREVGGFSTEEVAEAEHCTPEAVRQRLVEARRRLHELLAPHLKERNFQGV